ncbi:MAG: glycosyltransferase family 4 protein [Chloroflexi bacterium]|nr:glycosyltransferase family 4 protein [Chloroflexota bacterium]
MRIAITTNLFPPIQTGTAHYAQELAQNLARAGHDVTVITCSLINEYSQEIVDGYKVFRLPSYKLPVSKLLLGFEQFYLGYIPGNKRRVKEILVQERIEIVHHCSHLLDLVYLVPGACKQLGIPAVCSIHTLIHYPGNKFIERLMVLVDKTFIKWLAVLRYQGMVALDVLSADYIRDRYHHPNIRNVTLCIGPDVLEFPPANALDQTGTFKILSVGHVTSMRHRVDLIRAVHRLVQDGFDVKLTIVGKVLDPTPVKLVEELDLSEIVCFKGEMSRSVILELAREYHVEAHWITIPGLGTAIIESMALGLPTMTYGYSGMYGDVPLADMENIVFIPSGDVEQIAKKLAMLANTPALRISIGSKARELVSEFLTWPKAVADLGNFYSEIIVSHKTGQSIG